MEKAEESARRRCLAEVERELAGLQHRHDIAMSAFLFEEATALGREIAALDRQRQALMAALPTAEPEPPAGVVPVLDRPRRRRRR